MLPKEAIEEYKEIYKKVYRKEISDEQASNQANRLVRMYSTVLKNPRFTSLEDLKLHQEYSSELRDNK